MEELNKAIQMAEEKLAKQKAYEKHRAFVNTHKAFLHEKHTSLSLPLISCWGANEKLGRITDQTTYLIRQKLGIVYDVDVSYGQSYKILPFVKSIINYCVETEDNKKYFEIIQITQPKIFVEEDRQSEKYIWINITSNVMCGGITLRFKKT